jgi:hypothetical protein
MPGTWSGDERLSPMKYQMVMIISLLCNRLWLGGRSPAFALICQYLASTVRDLAHSTFSPRRRKIWRASFICMRGTICENNYLE